MTFPITGRRHSRRSHEDALAAFVTAKAEIDVLIERLQRLSGDHFGADPETVDWGDVGTLQLYRARLREIADIAFREGEHAG